MQEPLIIEYNFNAPAEEVWQAITDRNDMKNWYFDAPEFKPEVGTEFTFKGENEGRVYIHHCTVLEVIPGRKLRHTWIYEVYGGNSIVTFELFPEGDQTKIKLTHEGLETFPDLPDFKRESFQAGWTEIIGTLLKNYVEN